jgi:hypothetical protein
MELWQRVCRALATACRHEEAASALYTSEALAQSVGRWTQPVTVGGNCNCTVVELVR